MAKIPLSSVGTKPIMPISGNQYNSMQQIKSAEFRNAAKFDDSTVKKILPFLPNKTQYKESQQLSKESITEIKQVGRQINSLSTIMSQQINISTQILGVLKAIQGMSTATNGTGGGSAASTQQIQQQNKKTSNKIAEKLGSIAKNGPAGAVAKSAIGRVLGVGAIAAGIGGAAYLAYRNNQSNRENLQTPGFWPSQEAQVGAGVDRPPLMRNGQSWSPAGGSSAGGSSAGGSSASGSSNNPDGGISEANRNTLGSIAEKYESGGKGVGFISSGKDDPGGQSYGKHQLSTKDSMGAFLRSEEGKPYAQQFQGLSPGTPEFNSVYQRIAAANPEGFGKSQKDFYTRTHYQPLLEHAKKLGYDVNNRGVQEALFSMSVQHGRAADIVSAAAAKGVGANPQEQLTNLYRQRTEYVSGLTSLKPNIKESLYNRYRNEQSDAIAYSKPPEETPNMSSGGDAPKISPEQQRTRRDYWRGSLQFGDQTYRYGTGVPNAPGGTPETGGNSGSVPLGQFDIKSGLHSGRNPRFQNNSFYVKDMFDSKWGRNRSAVLFHSARDLDKMYSAGCFAIDPRQWPKFRAQMLDTMKKHGDLVVRVNPDGSAQIMPKSQATASALPSSSPKTPENFIASETTKNPELKNDPAGSYNAPSDLAAAGGSETTKNPELKNDPAGSYNAPSDPATAAPTEPSAGRFASPTQQLNDQAVQRDTGTGPPPVAIPPGPAPSATPIDPNINKTSSESKDQFFDSKSSQNGWAPSVMNYWKQGKEGINV